ncbi:MAG: hypothetical protein M3Z66_08580 [Chloroflexota bacterium]|nr:hypothetical protein [Chloroflexota bacterium]
MGRQQQRRRQQQRQKKQEQRQPVQKPTGGIGRWGILGGAAVIILVIIALVFAAMHQNSAANTALTPTPIPTKQSLAAPVDGIQCGQSEQLAYHIHQHITLIDHGKTIPLPSSIGMPGGEQNATCFYWIHVHAFTPDIIHVESPIKKTFTLGNFFDIWKATASSASPSGDAYVKNLTAAAGKGQVTAFANGKRWTAGYRSIPLREHETITIEIGKPVVPPRPYTNWGNL